MSAVSVWKEKFRVRSYETGPTGRASVATICNYLQEVAGNHAFRLGVSVEHLHERRLTWVLTRLRVFIDNYPHWRDEITIETWPSGVEGLFATRDFLLQDDSGRRLGRATSGWMIIDLDRRRPVRMPEIITSLEPPRRDRAVAEASPRLATPASETEHLPIRVEYSDLDVNGHVNNVRYVEWALDAMSAEELASHDLTELDVHYRAEAVYGDAVAVHTGPLDGEDDRAFECTHVIMQRPDRKELARLRTKWKPR